MSDDVYAIEEAAEREMEVQRNVFAAKVEHWRKRAEAAERKVADLEDGEVVRKLRNEVAQLHKRLDGSGERCIQEFDRAEAATRKLAAIRELHRKSMWPINHGEHRGNHYCMACTTGVDDYQLYALWPCPTVRAIGEVT